MWPTIVRCHSWRCFVLYAEIVSVQKLQTFSVIELIGLGIGLGFRLVLL